MNACSSSPLHYFWPASTGTHGMTRYNRAVQDFLPGCGHAVRTSQRRGASVLEAARRLTGLGYPANGVTHALDVRSAFLGADIVSVMDLIPWLNRSFYGTNRRARAWLAYERALYSPGLKTAKARIAISHQTAKDLDDNGTPATRVAHIPVSESFKRAARPRSHRPRGTLLIGANEPRKQWENAADVSALTGEDVAWIGHDIGGPSNLEYEGAVIRRLARYSRVRRLREAPEGALAEGYAQASVMLVTSRWEGYCIPIIEALYAGCPVVAYDPAWQMEWVDRVFGRGAIPRLKNPIDVPAASAYDVGEAYAAMDEKMHVGTADEFTRIHQEVQSSLRG